MKADCQILIECPVTGDEYPTSFDALTIVPARGELDVTRKLVLCPGCKKEHEVI